MRTNQQLIKNKQKKNKKNNGAPLPLPSKTKKQTNMYIKQQTNKKMTQKKNIKNFLFTLSFRTNNVCMDDEIIYLEKKINKKKKLNKKTDFFFI